MAEFEPLTPPLDDGDEFDRFISPDIRARLEERYWRPIERATVAESFLTDETFFADPGSHPATFSDHGVVHVRDVARRGSGWSASSTAGCCRRVRRSAVRSWRAARCDGLPARHRHGGGDARRAARAPAVRRETALGAGFDDLADQLWSTDAARLRSRIEAVGLATTAVPGEVVLREVLALSLCHSKSAVPAHLLDDPVALRALMIRGAFTSLDRQTAEPREALRTSTFDGIDTAPFVERYRDVTGEAFGWPVDTRPAAREFVDDVIDAIRVLRAPTRCASVAPRSGPAPVTRSAWIGAVASR